MPGTVKTARNNKYPGVYFQPKKQQGKQWLALINRKELHYARLFPTPQEAYNEILRQLIINKLPMVRKYTHTDTYQHKGCMAKFEQEFKTIYQCATCAAAYLQRKEQCRHCGSWAIEIIRIPLGLVG